VIESRIAGQRPVKSRAGGCEPERGRRVDRVADVKVVGERLGPVFGRVHGGVGGDELPVPAGRGALRIVTLDGGLVVEIRIAEQLLEPFPALRARDEYAEVVVTDLVPEVAEQGPVGLVHRRP